MSQAEKKRILEHDQFLAAKGLSEKRRLVYFRNLPRIRHLIGKPLLQASKQDIIKMTSVG